MMAVNGWGPETGELNAYGYTLSIMQDKEKSFGDGYGGRCTINVYLIPLNSKDGKIQVYTIP